MRVVLITRVINHSVVISFHNITVESRRLARCCPTIGAIAFPPSRAATCKEKSGRGKGREGGRKDQGTARGRALTTAPFVAAVEAVEDIVAPAAQENATSVVATHFLLRVALPPVLFWLPAWIRGV